MVSIGVVEANGLEVSYGHRPVVTLEHLRIEPDAGVVGLFGPNGAGKSTLLRTIVGDINRFRGELRVPARHEISYLPDDPFLYPWLSVIQCRELFASRFADFRSEVFDRFLEGSKITLESRVSELSKGMSERLHLGLTMSRVPALYVLDEPLGGVDPVARDHLLDLITQLREPSVPLILSTHLINGVDRIFDQIVLISDGTLVAHASADSLREMGDGNLEAAYKKSVMKV